MGERKKFGGIQVLRAIAAISISISHIPFTSINGWNIVFGVDIFLVITGFLAIYTTENMRNFSIKNFLIKKGIRLLPLYWIITIGTYLAAVMIPFLLSETPSFMDLVKSLLLIPYTKTSVITGSTVIRPIVGPAHTLMYDAYFYIVFAIISKLAYKYRAVLTSAFLIIICVIGRLANFENVYLIFYSNLWVVDLVLGMLLFYAYNAIKRSKAVSYSIVWLVLFLSSLIIMVYVSRLQVSGVAFVIFKCIPAFLVVLSALLLEGKYKLPFIEKLGDISYSYYLIHYYVLVIIEHFIVDLNEPSAIGIAVVFVGLVLAEIAAYFSWKLIEIKFGNVMKSRLLA